MKKFLALLTTFIFLFTSCNNRITNPPNDNNGGSVVDPVGNDDTFEIMTWNIQNYPKNGTTTVNDVKAIIRDLEVDIIGVQEIGNITAFNALLDSLPGWQGILSQDEYSNGSYQKTGIIYKTSLISIDGASVTNIFTNDNRSFPRPPLQAFVQVKDLSGTPFDFTLIVLHLKAYPDADSELRRRSACEKLQEYIDSEIAAGSDPDFIVLGDWNDELSDAPTDNVFTAFLDKPDEYTFLTYNLGQVSYPSYNSLIDNILITSDCKDLYGDGTTTVLTLDLDSEIHGYLSNVSDHRPVMARFKGFALSLPQ